MPMENGRSWDIGTPKTQNQLAKFGMGHYVADTTLRTKTESNHPSGDILANDSWAHSEPH